MLSQQMFGCSALLQDVQRLHNSGDSRVDPALVFCCVS
jgi:hypothetical protein